ncbi:MAG: Ti-type conjugative transfer relaxase TraA [Methylorubrum rhodinum]|uniref:Ti-type conjugative transfer relaxase TraA n=1 Tax=Methylorubrum rhodinum TaxID=29428 RepID=UPI003BAF5F1A
MAIYHLSAQVISSASGRSAVAAAAYRRAASMMCEARAIEVSYEGKQHVAHTELALPAETPAWFRAGIDGRSENGASAFLWNAVEAKEGLKGTGLAMEMNIALPLELTREQNVALARDWVEEFVTSRGFIADWALHDSPGNPHFHVMIPLRRLTQDGFGPKFEHARDPAGNMLTREDGKPRYERMAAPMKALTDWRRSWEVAANRHLAMAGLELRIDHRSHREAGIEVEPTEHIGVTASNMVENGKQADRVREEMERRARNAQTIIDDPSKILPILTREKSVFDERDIAKALFRYIDDPALFASVRLRVGLSPELVAVAEEVIDPETERVISPARWTTRGLLRAELLMQSAAAKLWTDQTHVLEPSTVEKAILARSQLSDQQGEAVRHVTGPERIAALVGFAGAGKSTMLGVAGDAWKRDGYRVFGAALAGKAAEGLERSSGIVSRTLASWELAWGKDRDRLSRGDVLVLDEAGMVSSEQLSRIVQEVEKRGAKLVLVGDAMQLQPIEAGAAFRAITETIGHVELSEIWRQSLPWMCQASIDFARGAVKRAITAYHEASMVRFAPTREAAREAVIAAWKPDFLGRKPDGKRHETLILAQTNLDVFSLNEKAREALKAEGGLTDEARFVTARGERMFAAGDRVLFLENDRRFGVKNGMLATVEAASSGRLTVRLDRDGMGDGERIEVRAEEYRNLDHGYAATVHKAQGATLDRVHVLATPGMDRHLAYVAMSRHRHSVVLHAARDDFIPEWARTRLGNTPSFDALDKATIAGLTYRLSRDGSKASTLDHLSEAAFREAAAEIVSPLEPEVRVATDRTRDFSDADCITANLRRLAARLEGKGTPAIESLVPSSLSALARRVDAIETHARLTADRVRPQDLRALASAFAERRAINGHASLLPGLLARMRGAVQGLERQWQRLHRAGTRLTNVMADIRVRMPEVAARVRPAVKPEASVVIAPPAVAMSPVSSTPQPEAKPPFLPAVDLGEDRLDEAVLARIADHPGLAKQRAELASTAADMVRNPAPLVAAILSDLRQPADLFAQRVDALLADADTYGGLHGKSGLLASKAAKEQRHWAKQSEIGVRGKARRLKADFVSTYEQARTDELAYRERLRIEIPGLSPEAQSALERIGATAQEARNRAVAAAISTPEQRSEIEAFALAVGRRFGRNGSIGFRMEESLAPDHAPVAKPLRDLMNGAGIIAIRMTENRLEPDLALDRQHELRRERGPDLGPSL